jgi:GT2 family glycosyltransferase
VTPQVAVVVATHDRPELLAELLESLCAQDHPSLEVIVVDDASGRPTTELLESLLDGDERGILRVRRLDRNGGPARARNVGWRSTRSEVVLFTDDDCRASPTWASELAAPVLRDELDVVQGRTEPDQRDDLPMGPWDRTIRVSRWSGLFEGCNIAYRRSTLEAVGGFDESFPAAGGEDTDLGLRAVAAGARASFAEQAVVEHTIWRLTYRRYIRNRLRSVHLVRLIEHHPELRRQLPFRIFWHRQHAKTVAGLTVCGSSAAVNRALPPLLVGLWVVMKARHVGGPVPRRIVVAGLKLVADVSEVLAMAAESIRRRCLLL